jgi:intergrase/recombinase
LLAKDFSEVRDLRETLRPNVVKALSALSKFLGMYEDFKLLIKKHGLKWIGKSVDDIVIERLSKIHDPNEIFQWVKEVKQARPELSEFMDFLSATGLRLEEAIQSFNLIVKLSREDKLNSYYNVKAGCLEHFRFKDTFIRRSKKAFISFLPESMIKQVSDSYALKSKASVQQRVQKAGLKLRFSDVREAHASFMVKYLQQPEIDFLQGRISTNVFMSNYYNPKLVEDLRARVFEGIGEVLRRVTI